MLRVAEPLTLPCLFVAVNVAVHVPVVAPAATIHVSPVPCVTVATPVGPPQLSISETVLCLLVLTATVAVGAETVSVTEQGFTLIWPWEVHFLSGMIGERDCSGTCVEVCGVTPDCEPAQPASIAVTPSSAIPAKSGWRRKLNVDTVSSLLKLRTTSCV